MKTSEAVAVVVFGLCCSAHTCCTDSAPNLALATYQERDIVSDGDGGFRAVGNVRYERTVPRDAAMTTVDPRCSQLCDPTRVLVDSCEIRDAGADSSLVVRCATFTSLAGCQPL